MEHAGTPLAENQKKSTIACRDSTAIHPVVEARKLSELMERLLGEEWIALDTEANGLHAYPGHLCLIQLSGECFQGIVEPLAELNLSPLLELLSNKSLVLHSCEFDLRMLKTAGDFHPKKIFDTSLAARFLGHKRVGLAALVERYFGVKLPKENQKANWGQRPLSESMLDYARNDVAFLLPLQKELEEALKGLNRWEWYCQSCSQLVQGSLVESEPADDVSFWRLNAKPRFAGRSLAVLWELWRWREGEALRANLPPFRIMRNEQLVSVVNCVNEGLAPKVSFKSKRIMTALFSAIDKGRALPEGEWPVKQRAKKLRLSESQESVFNQIKERRDTVASKHAIDPALIISNAKIEALARGSQAVREMLLPWQKQLLGLVE